MWFLLLLLLSSCDSPPASLSPPKKPNLPRPLISEDPYASIRSHPWVTRQPLAPFSEETLQDIQSLKNGYDYLTIERQKQGLITPSFFEESEKITALLLKIQERVPFIFPGRYYQILNIRETPGPYQTVQKAYLGDSSFGLPLYLEARLFQEVNPLTYYSCLYPDLETQETEGLLLLKGKASPTAHSIFASEKTLLAALVYKDDETYALTLELPTHEAVSFESAFYETAFALKK